MNYEDFAKVVHERFNEIESVLTSKSFEYAPNSDRLEQFKLAGLLQGCGSVKALGGMLAKHTISVHQFINDPHKYTRNQFLEKIGDSINYLILLEALLIDEVWSKQEKTSDVPDIKFHIENKCWEPTC